MHPVCSCADREDNGPLCRVQHLLKESPGRNTNDVSAWTFESECPGSVDAHTSEKGPGELLRNGLQVSCVLTGMITTELKNGTNSEGALREQCAFLPSRVEGWIGGPLSR
eukprot:395450-Rhodomonas_salina.1